MKLITLHKLFNDRDKLFDMLEKMRPRQILLEGEPCEVSEHLKLKQHELFVTAVNFPRDVHRFLKLGYTQEGAEGK